MRRRSILVNNKFKIDILNNFLYREYIMYFYIFIGIIVLLLLCVIFYYKKEAFGDILSHPKSTDVVDITKQFTDMTVYENDTDGRLGLDKCLEQCNGNCVEYGQTGAAYCFPKVTVEPRNYNDAIVQNERKLSYPNVE